MCHLGCSAEVGTPFSQPRCPCLDLLGQRLVRQVLSVAQTAKVALAPAPDGAVGGASEAVVGSSRHSDDALASKGLDLLRQQLELLVAVAQPAKGSIAPAPDSAVGGEGEAVLFPCRDSDDAPASKGLDLLGQQLALPVADDKPPAIVSIAPAPDTAAGGEGEAVVLSSRHGDDALPSEGLDLLGQQLALRVAVAQLAIVSTAPAPDGAVGGEGDAVRVSSRHSDDALPSKGLDLLGQQLALRVAVAQLAEKGGGSAF